MSRRKKCRKCGRQWGKVMSLVLLVSMVLGNSRLVCAQTYSSESIASEQKAAQVLENYYNAKEGILKKQIGSRFRQRVSGAKTTVTFQSSNPKVAQVNETTGQIECVGVGKALITSKAAESDEYKEAKKCVTLTVIPRTAGVRVLRSNSPGRVTIESGGNAVGNDGYRIQYKNAGKLTVVDVRGSGIIRQTIKGLKSGSPFKVRMRAYKIVDGKVYYGKYGVWKTLKKVK